MSLPTDDRLSALRYELRASRRSPGGLLLEVWQLPAPGSPQVKKPRRVAGLKGRNLDLIEHRVLRRLARDGIDPTGIHSGGLRTFPLQEAAALPLGLLFRVLAPMRGHARMMACAEGIEAMETEEASYWLGMAMHRAYPRRVLMALRCLLIDPKRLA